MDRGLVVLEESAAHHDLLREAAEHADGVDADLLLLMLLDESEYERDMETLKSIGSVENVSYGEETVLASAKQDVDELAQDAIGEEFDVEWDVLVDVVGDEHARAIVQAGADNGCDHAFILGQQRSPPEKSSSGTSPSTSS